MRPGELLEVLNTLELVRTTMIRLLNWENRGKGGYLNRKDDLEKKRNRLHIRLTDAEFSAIKRLSQRLGLTYTETILKAIFSLGRNDGRGER